MKIMPSGRRLSIQLSILVTVVLVGLNYQALANQLALYTFQPSAELAPLIDQLQLTTRGKAILYRARPQLDDKAAFNADCNPSVGQLELGCYAHGRIYVLKITNQSLAPEMMVVLAHELLHAVWAQTPSPERQQLGVQLESVYRSLGDADLTARMASYAQSEPGQQNNELHSILGTEYPKLTPSLEASYATIFTDRAAIVAAHTAYKGVFARRKAQLDAELSQIRSLKAELTALEAQMAADRSRGSVTAYNALVPRQNALVSEVNALITQYQTGVDEYNALSVSLESAPISPSVP